MLSSVVSRVIILSAGVVYPAYSSYKSVKEKNVKGYIKWLMYWVVYAIFASVESIADMFVAWIPFYYEMKILILLWLVSPVSRGSIQFYVRCLHPLLTKRENEIDACLSHVKDLLYFTVVKLFRYLFNMLRSSVSLGHGLILDQIKMRYGLQDVKKPEEEKNDDSEMDEAEGPEEGDLPSETVPAKSEVSHRSVLTTVASHATAAIVSADTRLPSVATPTPVATTDIAQPATTHSTDRDSKSSTLGHRGPHTSRDTVSSYDRYTRLSYAPLSSSSSSARSSSYSSASTGTTRTYTGSSLYDHYTRPTSSSTSRYSGSSSYSGRYSKK